MYYIYILYSEKFDRYYIGQCQDLSQRLQRHNSRGVISTRNYVPWALAYFEKYESRDLAMKREKEIKKKKSRRYIEFLIGGGTGSHVPI